MLIENKIMNYIELLLLFEIILNNKIYSLILQQETNNSVKITSKGTPIIILTIRIKLI